MNIEEIKKEALEFKAQNITELSDKVFELKNKGVSFLGCVAFVQTNQQLSLAEARKMTLGLECWSSEDKARIDCSYRLMLSEFEE
ncbi:hypothetical protein [Bacteroides sp. 519]|uniref:hypothetical protein n=1 Tax=Bacteroides sp. 519 TaxID=2302937 RepID=UPI0013D4237E|nr:hypothetical protein [Bacteroides sp. 519]NDV57189.1 hypothetical protein [Bacteroides sp. 519]